MVRSALRLPYGMLDGKLTHVSQVLSGLACGCRCPGCDAPLVAKKGKANLHHFAHAKDADCGGGVETALHLAAKEIIERRKCIFLPAVEVVSKTLSYHKVLANIAPEKDYSLDQVALERRVDSIVPDLLAYVRGRPIAIEIRVTHAVDEEKTTRFRSLGLSAIEIDLSKAPRTFTLEELEPFVIGPGPHKSWVFNAVADRQYELIISRGRERDVYKDSCWRHRGCRWYRRIGFVCIDCEHYLEDIDEGLILCSESPPSK